MKFSLSTMLIVIAAIAVWLGTFTITSQVGSDVRQVCRVLVLVWAAANVIYARGWVRAFWLGFAFVWLMYQSANSLKLFDTSTLEFNWARLAVNQLTDSGATTVALYAALYDTFLLLGLLSVSTLGGIIFALVYRRNRARSASDNPTAANRPKDGKSPDNSSRRYI